MILINPLTRQVLNANPEGCNQFTGKNCKGPDEMDEEEFNQTFGIHATDDPDKFESEDRQLEVTRPGRQRFFKDSPVIVVRDRRGNKLAGEHYVAGLEGKYADVVTRDQEEADAYEKGHKALLELLKKRKS